MTESACLAANVRFLGRRNDVQTIIAASDIVIVPSVWAEAFGLIVAEAMACERPLVASQSGGIPELIENGITGFLAPCGDSQKFAKSISDLLSNDLLRQRLGRNGREKILHQFNLLKQADQLIEIYREVLNNDK